MGARDAGFESQLCNSLTVTFNRGYNLSELNFFPYIQRIKFVLYRVVVRIRENIFFHSFYKWSFILQTLGPRYSPGR